MRTLEFLRNTFLLTTFSLLAILQTEAQNDPLKSAEPLLKSGLYGQAADVYTQWLNSHPDDFRVWRALGYAQSWKGANRDAIRSFGKAIEGDPADLDARLGLGYAYAWNKEFGKAANTFEAALGQSPGNEEATKGLAYTALWSGNSVAAVRQFYNLTYRYPENYEYQIALGNALRDSGQSGKAARAYQKAKSMAPEQTEPARQLELLRRQSTPIEVDIWGGVSTVGQMRSEGLRLVQLAGQVTDQLRLFAKYDRSLSVDNLDLLSRDVSGNVYSLGGYYNWTPETGTNLETSVRQFSDQHTQFTVRAEQLYFLPNNAHIKGGLMAGFSKDQPTEYVLFGGGNIPLTSWFAIEPTYFFTRLSSFSNDHRLVLNGKMQLGKGYELNAGALAGWAQLQGEQNTRKLSGGYILALAPVSRPLWLMFSYRYEKGFFDDLSAVSLGLKLRFGQDR